MCSSRAMKVRQDSLIGFADMWSEMSSSQVQIESSSKHGVLLYYRYQTYLLEWRFLFDRVMGLVKGIWVDSAHSS